MVFFLNSGSKLTTKVLTNFIPGLSFGNPGINTVLLVNRNPQRVYHLRANQQ